MLANWIGKCKSAYRAQHTVSSIALIITFSPPLSETPCRQGGLYFSSTHSGRSHQSFANPSISHLHEKACTMPLSYASVPSQSIQQENEPLHRLQIFSGRAHSDIKCRLITEESYSVVFIYSFFFFLSPMMIKRVHR